MDQDPAADVMWLLRGQWVTLAIRAALRLGLFELLDTPRTAAELAPACEADPGALARLLRALTDVDLVGVDEAGRFTRTPRGDTLTSAHPSQLRSLALMQTVVPNLAAWCHLDDAVRAGGAVYEQVNGIGPWDQLAADPDQNAIFNAAMARRSSAQLDALDQAGPLTGDLRIVDVGGGKGAMLAGLLRSHSDLRGVLADRENVVADAAPALAEFGDRVTTVPTDFFTAVPSGGDVYLMANVLHDWDDEPATAILRNVTAVMGPQSRLWIVEQVLDAPGRSPERLRDLHFVDLHMLVMFGARERTTSEYDDLCRTAGLGPVRLLTTGGSWNVLEARLPAT